MKVVLAHCFKKKNPETSMTKVHKSKKLKPDLHHLYGIPEANHLSQDLNALKPCIPVADSF